MRHRHGLLIALAAVLVAPAAAAAAPAPYGLTCTDANGVRECRPADAAQYVPSFDGVPLDADVTLPPTGDGPFPTLVMLHGYGGDKTAFEATTPEGASSTVFHYNTNFYARQGYAVLTYSARGFGNSCGRNQQTDPRCRLGMGGYIHLKDQRVEIRDTQHLLGRLVDEGVAKADALGATGISYGGGETIMLAYQRDRIRKQDYAFAPWTSPKGTPLRLAAGYARWPWSDLASSLAPNGRFLDDDLRTNDVSRAPAGVLIQSYVAGLFASGQASGFYAPPGTDPTADLDSWYARTNAGEPYDGEPSIKAIINELHDHHSAVGVPLNASGAAPLLLQSGWTDDLFPPHETLRVYEQLRARDPKAEVSLQFGDLGHSRGSNKTNANVTFNDQGAAFFARHLKGGAPGAAPKRGSVTAFTQTCPKAAPAGGPFAADAWPAIHPGSVVFGATGEQRVASTGGDPSKGAGLDPIGGGSDACRDFPASDDPGTAVARTKVGKPFTLLGLPEVRATITTTGAFGQLPSRLWDVRPDGRQVLVSRGSYRLTPNQTGPVRFQLNGNGYRFEAGHEVKLELLGRDAPYLRASNGEFTVAVKDLKVILPATDAAAARSVPGGQAAADAVCSPGVLEAARVRPSGRGLRMSVPAGSGPVSVDVFQQSAGRSVVRERLVARFSRRTGSFTWSGRANRAGRTVADGVYAVRFRARTDQRRVAVERRGARFRGRPGYSTSPACGLVRLFKLERPVFGGPRGRALGVAFRLGRDATATVRALRGSRVLRSTTVRPVRAGRLVRMTVPAARVPRGDVRVQLRVGGDVRTLTARRL